MEENSDSLNSFRNEWKKEIVQNQNAYQSGQVSSSNSESTAMSLFQAAVDLERNIMKFINRIKLT